MKKGSWIEKIAKMVAPIIIATIMGTACPNPIPPIVPNLPPEKPEISWQDNGDGTVNYEMTSTDSDGNVTEIEYQINRGAWESSNGEQAEVTVPISEGSNIITARAYDDMGSASQSTESSFYSPTEEEATDMIAETAGSALQGKNATLSLGNTDVYVDVLVKMPDGKDGVINYRQNTGNGSILGLYGIPYLDVENKTSTENLENYVIEFLENSRGSKGLEKIAA